MRVKEIAVILRRGGFFYYKDQVIPAVRPGNGYGVALLLEPSQVDKDFNLPTGEGVLFVSAKQIKEIVDALDRSDQLTFEMLKCGWKGERPCPVKVVDFV